jgi:hypothetical protein
MTTQTIPELRGASKRAATTWFSEMHKLGLLFCLDTPPHDIYRISDGARTFTDEQVKSVTSVVNALFDKHGDAVHEFAFEVVSKTFHTPAERRTLKTMYG